MFDLIDRLALTLAGGDTILAAVIAVAMFIVLASMAWAAVVLAVVRVAGSRGDWT